MSDLVAIFIGGGMGSLARYGVGKYFTSFVWLTFPFGTLLSNLIAALILGLFLGFSTARPDIQNSLRFLVAVGFCGGFSTFSAFSAESFELLSDGNLSLFILNIIANLGGCLLMIGIGFWIVKNIYQ